MDLQTLETRSDVPASPTPPPLPATASNPRHKPLVAKDEAEDLEAFYHEVGDAVGQAGGVYRLRGQFSVAVNGQLVHVQKDAELGKLFATAVDIRKDGNAISLTATEAAWIRANPLFHASIPEISFFTELPVVDGELNISRPGYNPASGVFYQGPLIEPTSDTKHLDALLGSVWFRRDVDRVNFLGFLITLVLGRRYQGKRPICLIVGNSFGVGKTTLAHVLAAIASPKGELSSVTYVVDDSELEKRISAVLSRTQTRVVLVDNIRLPAGRIIASPCIERTITVPEFSFRRVGTSTEIRGENDLQFLFTFNGGTVGPDLASRCVPVHLFRSQGVSGARASSIGEPVEYVKAHRTAIVGELVGLVERWKHRGAPRAAIDCRFPGWAADVGGVLEANGLTGFLSTLSVDLADHDETALALRGLAETNPNRWLRPSQWLPIATDLGLWPEELRGRKPKGGQVVLGKLLAKCVGKRVQSEEGRVFRLSTRAHRNGPAYAFIEDADASPGGPREMREIPPMPSSPHAEALEPAHAPAQDLPQLPGMEWLVPGLP